MGDTLKQSERVNGRWTKLQHEKFILGLQLYGKDWKKIEALVATRNGAQIRSHAQKYFIKVRKEDEGDCENENLSQPEQTSPLTQLSSSDSDNYSYYLSKIVGKFSNEEDFDFWSHLIDHKPTGVEMPEPSRKNSFVSIASESDYEGLIPCKRVKSQ